jgi:hypothetical protein
MGWLRTSIGETQKNISISFSLQEMDPTWLQQVAEQVAAKKQQAQGQPPPQQQKGQSAEGEEEEGKGRRQRHHLRAAATAAAFTTAGGKKRQKQRRQPPRQSDQQEDSDTDSESGERNGSFEMPFMYKTDHFTKTGSGQTQGSTQKRLPFFLYRRVRVRLGLRGRAGAPSTRWRRRRWRRWWRWSESAR